METIILICLLVVGLYLAAGLVFSVYLFNRRIHQLDEGTKGSPLSFYLLIFPGTVLFWPVLFRKWMIYLSRRS
ncbi:MAG TPA: hypothetical protein PKL85_14115 [Bacteroidia bacterium]|nr:hypothetical protein [Bacteroidia bacterium]